MKNILVVDQNPLILNSYRYLFSTIPNSWCTFCSSTGIGAIQYLSSEKIDVIITDIYMPQIVGIDLLEYVKRKYPSVLRIIISSANQKYNKMPRTDLAHRFIEKPKNLDDIKELVKESYHFYRDIISENAVQMLTSLSPFPSIPKTYCELMVLTSSHNYTLTAIGELIEKDDILTDLILRVVNTPVIGLINSVKTPVHAASLLGVDMISSLVLSAEIFEVFPISDSLQFNQIEFIEHSILCASFVKAILNHERKNFNLSKDVIELGFLAGLLHDIGQICLASLYPEQYEEVQKRKRDSQKSLWELEQEILGVTHSEIGAYLLKLWGFNEQLCEIIAIHHMHDTSDEINQLIFCALYWANLFSYEFAPGNNNGRGVSLYSRGFKEGITYEKLTSWYSVCSEHAGDRGLIQRKTPQRG